MLVNKARAWLRRIVSPLDKPLPVVLERELANIVAELGKQVELIAVKQKEIVVVNARYDNDKQRWADLRRNTEASANGAPGVMPTTAKQ